MDADHPLSVSILKLIRLIPHQICVIILGCLASLVNGCIFPAFAIIFGELIDVFSRPTDEVLAGTHLWAGLFFILGVVSAVALLLKVGGCVCVAWSLCMSLPFVTVCIHKQACVRILSDGLSPSLSLTAYVLLSEW